MYTAHEICCFDNDIDMLSFLTNLIKSIIQIFWRKIGIRKKHDFKNVIQKT